LPRRHSSKGEVKYSEERKYKLEQQFKLEYDEQILKDDIAFILRKISKRYFEQKSFPSKYC
jgi:hypothetical protein